MGPAAPRHRTSLAEKRSRTSSPQAETLFSGKQFQGPSKRCSGHSFVRAPVAAGAQFDRSLRSGSTRDLPKRPVFSQRTVGQVSTLVTWKSPGGQTHLKSSTGGRRQSEPAEPAPKFNAFARRALLCSVHKHLLENIASAPLPHPCCLAQIAVRDRPWQASGCGTAVTIKFVRGLHFGGSVEFPWQDVTERVAWLGGGSL
jgi:hypothetical protein